MRLRVLALLGLGRFDEADVVMGQAGDDEGAGLRDFISGYPSLVFRQRLTAAHRLLQDAKVDDATTILEAARPTNDIEAAGLAYCRAFSLTMSARQSRHQRRDEEARSRVMQAMDLLEPHLRRADANERSHLVELYDRLEKELETYGGV
jgi:hypothetical protein